AGRPHGHPPGISTSEDTPEPPGDAVTVTVAPTCTACGVCLATCPERALVPAPRRPAVLDSLCTDCLACLEVCPVDAIVPSVHPIAQASYRILAVRVDLSPSPPRPPAGGAPPPP